MNKFEILEHIGDVKMRAYGRKKEELFQNAMLGMMAILKPRIERGELRMQNVQVRSPDINALLVDFLNEVNYLRQVHVESYDHIEFEEFSNTHLKAILKGKATKSFGEDIKAVTFHELDIRRNEKEVWHTNIVFDV